MVVLHWQGRRHCKAGETAPVSGIYKATHIEHRAPHEVFAIVGERLPPCRTCKNEVVFDVVRPVDYVLQDWDLARPSEWAERAA